MAFGKTLSEFTAVATNPTTTYPIYVINLADQNVSTITQVMLNSTSLTIKNSTSETSLTDIYTHFAEETVPADGVEWSLNNNSLTVYTDVVSANAPSYQLVLTGTREPLPISSLDDQLDIPPEDLELFINYAIRESAQLLGKVVPPAVEQNILELEGE